MTFNEDSRVKIPAILHLAKLGYEYLTLLKATKSVRVNLSQDKIKDLHILIPNSDIIDKFYQNTNITIRKTLINQKENQELTSLRDWLLPMLMNGQVQVGDVEDDDIVGMAAEPVEEYKIKR